MYNGSLILTYHITGSLTTMKNYFSVATLTGFREDKYISLEGDDSILPLPEILMPHFIQINKALSY